MKNENSDSVKMLDREKIRQIYQRAAEEKWPYPYIFNSLKAIGVERYETNVLTHEITYVGGGASFKERAPAGFQVLTAAPAFNLEALKAALGRVQRRETNYPQFLSEIAAAGVSFYRVDMKPRTVTYHGPGRDKYVEKVPETAPPSADIRVYHVHVYFDAGTRASAEALRDGLRHAFEGEVRVHELIDEPIGPHPLPMFEADVPAPNIEAVRTWLAARHGAHSILVHPLSGDDLADHRDFPQWIGEPLKLDLEFLKKLQR